MLLSRHWLHLAAVGTLAAILIATLTPATSDTSSGLCLICGHRGAADAVLNIGLFLPVGVSLALLGWSAPTAVIAAFIFTGGIETTQFFIPGRDASVGDIAFNTAGALFGIALVRSAGFWAAPSPRTAALLSVCAGSAVGLIVLSTGLLLETEFRPSTYRAEWAPLLSSSDRYQGQLESVKLGSVSVGDGPMANADELLGAFRTGSELHIVGRTGAPTSAKTALFGVRDRRNDQVLTVAQQGQDLILRVRRRAAAWRFSQPDLRARGLWSDVAVDSVFRLTIRHTPPVFSIRLNSPERVIALFAHDGWTTLMGLDVYPSTRRAALGVLWLSALILPFGFWARRSQLTIVGGAAGLLGMAVTWMTNLFAGPAAIDLLGVTGGLVVGWLVRRLAARLARR